VPVFLHVPCAFAWACKEKGGRTAGRFAGAAADHGMAVQGLEAAAATTYLHFTMCGTVCYKW